MPRNLPFCIPVRLYNFIFWDEMSEKWLLFFNIYILNYTNVLCFILYLQILLRLILIWNLRYFSNDLEFYDLIGFLLCSYVIRNEYLLLITYKFNERWKNINIPSFSSFSHRRNRPTDLHDKRMVLVVRCPIQA